MSLKTILGVVFSLIIGTSAFAHNERIPAPQTAGVPQEPEDVFTFASRFTVKVVNRLGNIFDFKPGGGHGSGFLYEIRTLPNGEQRGVIFTNKHVVTRPAEIFARKVVIQFQTETAVPETIPVDVVYESNLNDFAVLEFNMSDLKRVKGRIRPAMLSTPDSPFYDFSKNYRALVGEDTLAHGSPLNSNAVITYGKITAINTNPIRGDYIQTQTPINPGNSGGPLISLELRPGEVIGMNSEKMNGADNTGFAIPIAVLTKEYAEWRKNPALARTKRALVRWNIATKGELEITGADEVIKAHLPKFFLYAEAALKVDDADPATNLKTGDVVISINGEMAMPSIYELHRLIQQSPSPLHVEVVRNGKIIALDVPIEDTTRRSMRQQVDFVYVSGMLFRPNDQHYFNQQASSKVILQMGIDSPELANESVRHPEQFSLLTNVNIEGRDYPIVTLADLKKVLTENKTAKFFRLDVYAPAQVDAFGSVIHQNTKTSYLMPLLDVVLPSKFSIHQFAENLSFEAKEPQSRVWRNFRFGAKAEAEAAKKALRDAATMAAGGGCVVDLTNPEDHQSVGK